jgi:hypothetical protein
MNSTFYHKLKQFLVGIIAICVPIIVGIIIWPNLKMAFECIRDTQPNCNESKEAFYISYEYEGKQYKVPNTEYLEFESLVDSAYIFLTFEGENYRVPLNKRKEFIEICGINNVKISAYDANKKYRPELSIHQVPMHYVYTY